MNLQSSMLLTDLYQLTMLQGYFDSSMEDEAVFEFFVRDLPQERNFLMAAGLEQVLQYLENACFSAEELEWLAASGKFSAAFVSYLENWRFQGDVHAMQEGTVFFPDEPILRVTAPLPQAQLVETRIINLLHYQTLVASKAARCTLAAPGKLLVDFGLRRAHAAEAGLLAARSCYLAGFAGSSNVLADALYAIPSYGTMAHSYIQAHDSEVKAFENFARAQPGNVTLLIDTYDTEAAARKVVELAPRLQQDGISVKAVRLDSGDLAQHARKVRAILDEAGMGDVAIFSSGNLDEYRLRDLLAQQAPIDGFGVGTRLDTSADAAYLDCAYKLTEYAGLPRRKHSESKTTWPGRKQVYRHYGDDGRMSNDLVTLEDDKQPGEPLLYHVMTGGRRLQPPEALSESRLHADNQLARLPPATQKLETTRPAYTVTISEPLKELSREADLWIAQEQRRNG